MSCFICNKSFKVRPGTIKYLRRSQLTCKLQERKWEPAMLKPDVTIIEAIEDISDGDITLETLRKCATYYICHDCQVNLRQAVNKKVEVENNIEQLNKKVGQVSNTERRKYFKENYCKDKIGKCWCCLIKFVPTKNRNRWSDRVHLALPVVEGMSVGEAINTLLEEQAETLKGLYERKVYICKKCLQLIRNVIRSQCMFDTLHTIFKAKTVKDSVFTQLVNGELIQSIQNRNVDIVIAEDIDEEISGDSERIEDSPPRKSVPTIVQARVTRTDKRPYHKTVVSIPEANRATRSSKRRKVTKSSDVEDGDSDMEFETYSDSTVVTDIEGNKVLYKAANELESYLDVKSYDVDQNDVVDIEADIVTDSGESVEGNMQSWDISNDDTVENINKDIINTRNEDVVVHESTGSSDDASNKTRRQICVKVQLDGTQIKALSTVCNKGGQKEQTKPEIKTKNMAEDWVLYYYPKFSGRAEFVRLIFEETGTPYKECEETFVGIKEKIIEGKMEGYPHFAPPMIKKGNFQLSQTSVICRYLGEELGIYPDTVEDKLHAEQINVCCHDYLAEGRLAFHGINPVGPYLSQKEETQPYIDRFVAERFPRWMKYFERVLASNNGGKGYLFGEKLTYCDLGLFHILHASEAQFPDTYKNTDYMPLLKSFKERIASRPRLAAYLNTDRWRGFSGDSMM